MEEGWKQIFMSSADYMAEMAKDILEKQKIKVVLINHHDSSFPSCGEYCLYVAEEDEARAIDLLKDLKN